jgi:tetratricopeptide (TPR) repeat protein
VALAQRPDTTLDAQLRYLNLLRGQERTADAAVALDALLGLDDAEDKLSAPLFAQLLVARAEIHLANKNWDGAKPLLDQAVAIQGDNAAVLNFAGYSAIEARRDVDASFALIERAWRLDPDNAAITDSLGWAHFLLGRHDQAVALLEMAAARAPDNAIINEHLGDALWNAGRRFEARYAWAAATIMAEGEALARLKTKAHTGLTAALTAP